LVYEWQPYSTYCRASSDLGVMPRGLLTLTPYGSSQLTHT